VSIAAFSVAATLVLVLLPGSVAAYAVGLPFLFFVPGFAVVRLFFWMGTSVEAKFVLSLGLSILAVVALAFVLVLTPIGLAPDTARGSLVVFALSAVVLETAWLNADRSKKADAKDQTLAEPTIEEPGKPDRVVAAMIAAALVISVVSLGLIVTADYPSRTSFSLTDENGKVLTNTTRPQDVPLILVFHVKNGEDGPRNFTVNAYADQVKPPGYHAFDNKSFRYDSLANGEEWSQPVTLYFNQSLVYRMNFDLYIEEPGQDPVFYGQLHMWFIAP
jgi:hypothetical protein